MTTRFRFPVPEGTPVRVYRNLHARCWSVQTQVREGRRHLWKVAGHADALLLDRATFKVYERGRQRVLLTGVKNVHAYVLATLVCVDPFDPAPENSLLLHYNPRRHGHFYDDLDHSPIVSADRLWLSATGHLYAEGASE